MNTILAFWNSLEALNAIRQWITAVLVILAVVGFFVDRQATKLQATVDSQKERLAAETQKRLSPRILTDEQRVLFLKATNGDSFGEVLVAFDADDSESASYARAIRDTLVSGGFFALPMRPQKVFPVMGSEDAFYGVEVTVRTMTGDAPAFVQNLLKGLTSAKVAYRSRLILNAKANEVEINVGKKAPTD